MSSPFRLSGFILSFFSFLLGSLERASQQLAQAPPHPLFRQAAASAFLPVCAEAAPRLLVRAAGSPRPLVCAQATCLGCVPAALPARFSSEVRTNFICFSASSWISSYVVTRSSSASSSASSTPERQCIRVL
jgi:uncharacterized membrane protein YoaK (UPF0700 family)